MLMDLVEKNRSIRGYDHDRKVTREELHSMALAARLCPSSMNLQPLKYVLVCEEDRVAAVQAATLWARGLPELTLPHPGKEPTAFIVICQDTAVSGNLSRFLMDVGIAAQTMLLRAVEMDLGGCMIGSFRAEAVKSALSLEETLQPLLVLAVGKPDEEVRLTEAAGGKTAYYRDEKDRHYVPKRPLAELVIDR